MWAPNPLKRTWRPNSKQFNKNKIRSPTRNQKTEKKRKKVVEKTNKEARRPWWPKYSIPTRLCHHHYPTLSLISLFLSLTFSLYFVPLYNNLLCFTISHHHFSRIIIIRVYPIQSLCFFQSSILLSHNVYLCWRPQQQEAGTRWLGRVVRVRLTRCEATQRKPSWFSRRLGSQSHDSRAWLAHEEFRGRDFFFAGAGGWPHVRFRRVSAGSWVPFRGFRRRAWPSTFFERGG